MFKVTMTDIKIGSDPRHGHLHLFEILLLAGENAKNTSKVYTVALFVTLQLCEYGIYQKFIGADAVTVFNSRNARLIWRTVLPLSLPHLTWPFNVSYHSGRASRPFKWQRSIQIKRAGIDLLDSCY